MRGQKKELLVSNESKKKDVLLWDLTQKEYLSMTIQQSSMEVVWEISMFTAEN